MTHPTLDKVLNKEQYSTLEGQTVKFGTRLIKVMIHRTESRSGSWERGFKFTTSEYGLLVHTNSKTRERKYSVDHGVTWHPSIKEAMRSKNKVILDRSHSKEFAFEAIQKINRADNPYYKWHP